MRPTEASPSASATYQTPRCSSTVNLPTSPCHPRSLLHLISDRKEPASKFESSKTKTDLLSLPVMTDYHLKSHLRSIDQSLDRDHRRSNLVFTPGMMERIERARLKRISGLHERGRKRRRRMSGADTLTPTSTALSPTQAAFGVPKPSYEPASSDPPSPT